MFWKCIHQVDAYLYILCLYAVVSPVCLFVCLSLPLSQACTGPVVSLLSVIAELDHSTVVRLEAWLEQRNVEAEARVWASRTQATTVGTREVPASMVDAAYTGAVVSKAAVSATRDARGQEETEGQAPSPAVMSAHATTIQAQVRCCAPALQPWVFVSPRGCFDVTATVDCRSLSSRER